MSDSPDWAAGPEFPRFLADLMAAEVAAMRPGAPPLEVGRGDLDIDSLEQVRLALAVAAALQLTQADERLRAARAFPHWLAECRSAARGGAVGFRTSGSSGEPRLIVHDLAALAQEVEALAELFAGAARIVALVPAHHIYGFLFTVLLPARLGVAVADARAQAFPRDLRDGDLVVAFPTFWRAAAEFGQPWPEGVEGVSSGAPCPPRAGAALRALGLRRLVEIYGATDTGGIGWRQDAGGFRLFPHWRRAGDDRIAKNFGLGETGYDLPDVVAWEDERRLAPLHRRDGAVQVGGVNVYPHIVAAVLRSHPEVADAAVRLMRPHEGERLKAFVVPRDPGVSTDELRGKLEGWIADRLAAPQRPRAFSFGPALPSSDRGKPCDWPSSAPAGSSASS
jgi:long-chain acyl-CoA synthetase